MPRPLPLPDELLEEVLRRLPPDEPAELVRAALVSRRWCRIVSDRGFRRRFCEFHRRPPMLGMLYNVHGEARFTPTCALCVPRTDMLDLCVIDARHGRVLCDKGGRGLVVWEPIAGEVWELPFPPKCTSFVHWTAAVLCSAAAGACDHLDCHHGPFLVVFVSITVVYTYSSDAAAWSEPVWTHPGFCPQSWTGSALVGNALYFGNLFGTTALKYDLELCRASLIRLPSVAMMYLLPTMEDGGLGLVNNDNSNLYLWSTKETHEFDAKWERRVIELKTMFPVDVDVTKLYVIGSGVGIIFMQTGDEVYTIDLKTYNVKKVYKGTIHNVFPYMSFYTPALKGTCTGEGPTAGHSSA